MRHVHSLMLRLRQYVISQSTEHIDSLIESNSSVFISAAEVMFQNVMAFIMFIPAYEGSSESNVYCHFIK